MNYLHAYHAGNFADVFKHIVLVALIKSLIRKDNGAFFLDTHAGSGIYDLFSESSQKGKEFEHGIQKIFHEKDTPELITQYVNCVRVINKQFSKSDFASLRYYPGSPFFLRYFLRAQDRLFLTEMHPKECQALKSVIPNDRRITIQLMDGYLGLKSFLPPKERRGLILIDPPYERPNEFLDMTKILPFIMQRFETGVYAVWYPIKDRPAVDRFHRLLQEQIKRPMLIAEMSIYPETTATHLNGSGMLIINPPYQLDEQIQSFLPWLWKTLTIHGQGQHSVKMINN